MGDAVDEAAAALQQLEQRQTRIDEVRAEAQKALNEITSNRRRGAPTNAVKAKVAALTRRRIARSPLQRGARGADRLLGLW